MQAVTLACNPCLARPALRQHAASRAHRTVMQPVRSERADLSGEWEAVISMASMDDVLEYAATVNHARQPKNTRLHDVMAVNLVMTSPEASLEEVSKLLEGPPMIEGLPVVDADKKLVGVISKKDLAKGGHSVKDVMSTPPISLKASAPVADAAKCMVEHKFHRVPVVDDEGVCVGIVTRTDIFWVLSQEDQEGDSHLTEHGVDV